MASMTFSERLIKSKYNLDYPLDAARFQQTVFEFMELVRDDSLDDPNGEELIDKFCNLVNDKEVWSLAQMVVPEFRSTREEQYAPKNVCTVLHLCNSATSRYQEHNTVERHTCLNHVLNKFFFLPAPPSDITVSAPDGPNRWFGGLNWSTTKQNRQLVVGSEAKPFNYLVDWFN